MKKKVIMAIAAICAIGALASCGPKKTGGGGKLQSYNPSTGQYN